MTRSPRPPPPRTRLAHLLRRVGRELGRTPFDPGLPRRVERAIRVDLGLPPRRGLPRWAAVAAAVLLALAAGASTGSTQRAGLLAPPPPRLETPPPPHAPPPLAPLPDREREQR